MADRPVRADRHMSDFDSLLWTLQRDPRLSSGFANITLLDQPADLELLRARLLRAAAIFPQLRKRVAPGVVGLTTPSWSDDPDFDIAWHVRTVPLDKPGTLEQLCELAVEFCHRPYDGSRPLWEFLVVNGLEDGRGAILQRMHHSITDGIGGIRMSEQYIDLVRDAPAPEPIPFPPAEIVNAAAPTEVVRTLAYNARRQLGTVGRLTTATSGLVRHPSRLPGLARSTAGFSRAVVREAVATDQRRSPLWTDRSLDSSLHLIRVPLAEVRAVAKAHECSINDVFVAGAAGGAGAYHRAHGRPVHELRMAMPVSTRSDRSAGGNAFDMARVLVPTGADPRSRLELIHERLAAVRGEASISLVQSLAGIANVLPPAILTRTARRQVETIDFTTSNVRGAPFDLYMAGALIESNHPIGPLVGTAFNLTTLSYRGSLDMGLHIDRGAIHEPLLLAECIQAAFKELLSI